MRKHLLSILFFSFFSLSITSQVIDSLDVRLFHVLTAENDTITFLKTNANIQVPKPTILFCQGSLPIPLIIKTDYEMFVPSINNFNYWDLTDKYNIVVISTPNTPAIPPKHLINNRLQYTPYLDRKNEFDSLYLKNDYLSNYVKRAEIVLHFLNQQKWVKKDEISVIGHSQGSYVALEIAEKNPQIKALGYFAGNPAGRFTSYIRRARRMHLEKKTTSVEMQMNIDELYISWKDVLSNKADKEIQNTAPSLVSFTLPKWNSLIELNSPIFIAYGTEDFDSAETSELLPIYFDKCGKINYKMYPVVGHGHNFEKINDDGSSNWDDMRWDEVLQEFIKWLENLPAK